MATEWEQAEKKQVLISCTVSVFVPQIDLIISLITFTEFVITLHYTIPQTEDIFHTAQTALAAVKK